MDYDKLVQDCMKTYYSLAAGDMLLSKRGPETALITRVANWNHHMRIMSYYVFSGYRRADIRCFCDVITNFEFDTENWLHIPLQPLKC